jgi:hypothetical protein
MIRRCVSNAMLAALAILIGAATAQAQRTKLDVPILVGGTELDACGSLAEVKGLDAAGDNFLSVRSGPAATFREIDRLKAGDRVIICGEKGVWYAAVYPWSSGRDCKVGTRWPKRAAYTGPCKSGWIHSKFVEIIAG